MTFKNNSLLNRLLMLSLALSTNIIFFTQTRIQISTEYSSLGMGGSVKKIVGGEGVAALWKGVNAAWLREASYTSLRLGLYEPCKVAFGCTTKENTTFLKQFLAGSAAGALGSIAGNPFDVLKTKMMTAESASPPSISATARDLYKNQGISGFYRGIDSNVARAMVLNGTKMAVYDQAKGKKLTTYHIFLCNYGRILYDCNRESLRHD
jgi:Mitochondrial carrier protein